MTSIDPNYAARLEHRQRARQLEADAKAARQQRNAKGRPTTASGSGRGWWGKGRTA